ncbi:MAG TPA: outer membrane lipoprotein carrier protein LolA [Syntrophorhabdaceae bacterium]|nr:outer membrane lipoprotein carrier protein LolA [Syntrophorhabdaceae bacterium]
MKCIQKQVRSILVCCITVSLLLLSCVCQVSGQDTTPAQNGRSKAQVFDSLQNAVSGVQTLTSEFRQERRVSMLKEPVVSLGRFSFQKPDKLRWETSGPDPFGFFVNGDTAKQWKGKNGTQQAFDLQDNPVLKLIVDQIIVWTKADFKSIERQYTISVIRDNPVLLRLAPKSSRERKYVRHILISFEAETNYAKRVEIAEQGGDSTVIEFLNMKTNVPLDLALFQ